MGQDQSNTNSKAPSITSSHHKPAIDDLVEEDQEPGIIQVVEGPAGEEEDDELRLLRTIQKFEPFFKEQDKGFNLDNLLGIKSSPGSKSPRQEDIPDNLAVGIFMDLQQYVKENMTHINNEQRILLRRLAYVDQLSTSAAQTLATAFHQAKVASERVPEAAIVKGQAMKAQEQLIKLYQSLSTLEKHLDPTDKIDFTTQSDVKWIAQLSKVRTRALKHQKKDITTTAAASSTLPILEKVVGEPAFSIVEVEAPTSSLALNRLKGLSSTSLKSHLDNSDHV